MYKVFVFGHLSNELIIGELVTYLFGTSFDFLNRRK